jgi:hypothetical protein
VTQYGDDVFAVTVLGDALYEVGTLPFGESIYQYNDEGFPAQVPDIRCDIFEVDVQKTVIENNSIGFLGRRQRQTF